MLLQGQIQYHVYTHECCSIPRFNTVGEWALGPGTWVNTEPTCDRQIN